MVVVGWCWDSLLRLLLLAVSANQAGSFTHPSWFASCSRRAMSAEPSLFGDEEKAKVDSFFNDDTLPGARWPPVACSVAAQWLTRRACRADAPAEDLLKVYKKFAMDHAQELGKMREVLSESLSEAWSPENDIIGITTVRLCLLVTLLPSVVLIISACAGAVRSRAHRQDDRHGQPAVQQGRAGVLGAVRRDAGARGAGESFLHCSALCCLRARMC